MLQRLLPVTPFTMRKTMIGGSLISSKCLSKSFIIRGGQLTPQRHPTCSAIRPQSERSAATLPVRATARDTDPYSSTWQSKVAAGVAAFAFVLTSFLQPTSVNAAVQYRVTEPSIVKVGICPGQAVPFETPAVQSAAPVDMSELTPDEQATIRIFQASTPSVVNITNLQAIQSYYSLDVKNIPVGQGSGFVWDQDGHVVTNFHVVRGASEVKVTLLDQTTYTAKVLGADPDKDVAVLKLDMPAAAAKELKPVTVGSSATLLVGQRVFALGNPFGLDHTLTQGIISGLNRELNTGLFPIKNVIQTDAAINPGNSGGVLLDSKGRLIGINTAIADPTGKGVSSGVGFAIPIDAVKGLVDQILKYGRVIRPALGLTLAPPQVLRQMRMEGVLVLDVPKGSPASVAGMQATSRDKFGNLVLGDIIVAMDGTPIKTATDLFEVLDEKRVGDTVVLDVLRDGGKKEAKVKITLGERTLGEAE